MPPERAALLAAIAVNPDDDLPRLVYADWLDENGETDRAEFLRLQCHTARVGVTDPTWAPGKLREYDLFKAKEATWRPGSDEIVRMLSHTWYRGFPLWVPFDVVVDGVVNHGEWCNGRYHLGAGADDLVRLPDYKSHPRINTVHALSICDWRPEFLATIRSGSWPFWNQLRFDGHPTDDGLRQLMNAPAFGSVTHLKMWLGRSSGDRSNDVSASAWSAFAACIANRMEVLDIYDVSAEQARAMSRGIRWPKLRRLSLAWTPPDAILELCVANMPALSELSVNMPPRTEQYGDNEMVTAVVTLAESALVSGLRSLAISGWPSWCVERFWSAYRGQQLDGLSMWITDKATTMPSLAEMSHVPALQALRVLKLFQAPNDLGGLATPDLFPELHSLWIADQKTIIPERLRWRGGDRRMIVRNEDLARSPDRYSWSHWWTLSD